MKAAAARSFVLAGLALTASASAASGCAQNALLELYVEIPPPIMVAPVNGVAGGRATHVRLALVADEAEPEIDIIASQSSVVALPPGLAEANEAWMGLTLVRGVAPEANALTVRVIYCASASGCDPADRATWVGFEDVVLEHAFYTGRVTCFARPLTDENYMDGLVPAAAQEHVDACRIGGCQDAVWNLGNFCRASGDHFCAVGDRGDHCDQLHRHLEGNLVEP